MPVVTCTLNGLFSSLPASFVAVVTYFIFWPWKIIYCYMMWLTVPTIMYILDTIACHEWTIVWPDMVFTWTRLFLIKITIVKNAGSFFFWHLQLRLCQLLWPTDERTDCLTFTVYWSMSLFVCLFVCLFVWYYNATVFSYKTVSNILLFLGL